MGISVCWSFFVVQAVFVFCFSLQVALEFHGVRAYKVAGNETDRVALLEFKYKITDDPLGVLGSWNESIHFCQWYGVTCSRRHQRVTILDLQSLKLAGSISPYIGNFSFLKVVSLRNNFFTHEIPSEIGHLQRLAVIDIGNNSFSGEIPPEIDRLLNLQMLNLYRNSLGGEIPANISVCSNLVHFSVAYNQLVGKIPSEFGSLTKIEFLSTSVNNLTGSIPSSLGNLSSIQTLSLSRNYLDRNIPYTFGLLKNLVNLALGANRLSGTIPSSIFNISSIETIDVSNNQINGVIPLDFGFTLPNLRQFRISSNNITGAIPHSISNASKLEEIQIGGNKLTGGVPYVEKLQHLRDFIITSNNLGSGRLGDLNFICSLTNATSLERLIVNDNNFGGLLPACITNISVTLGLLLLDYNKIFGRIPIGIGNFVNLQMLLMSNNQFSGTIPDTIGKLQNLKLLYLDRNRLSGQIPFSIGNLRFLLQLDLRNNSLQGNIPSSLGQCRLLIEVLLSNNNLSGTIPVSLIGLSSLSISLDLSGNHLTGSLPKEIGNLKNLGKLDVSGNSLSGEIPSSLGSCISLEQINMQGNRFQGSIPSSFSSLKGLGVLDLSQNNLSGEIPNFFARLQSLQNLNLSYNDFVGMVPMDGIFKNESATSVLGNSKLCGGIPEFHLPKCGSKKSKQRRLTLAQKLIIAIVSGLVGLALMISFLFLYLVRNRKEKQAATSLINSLINLSYQNLYNATEGFSSANLIGAGSFGSVYKGNLDEGRTIVAVKVFNLLHHASSKSFTAECEALRNIKHRNLVKVLTACSGVDYQGNDFKALVFEFMPNGSLEEWLHPVTTEDEENETPRNLNLLLRLNIAIDVACALNYLHNDCQPTTAHCDLKPSNVLLDDKMTAHLGDFGLARFFPSIHKQTSSIGVKGSIGYIAPEYGLGSEVSTNGDIYSYGILLLEMVIRKRPTNPMFEGDLNLHSFARMALPGHVMDIVDPILLNDDDDEDFAGNLQTRINRRRECLISMIRIGVACSVESPQNRMNISNVVNELQSIKKVLFEPENMFNRQRDN